MAILMGMSDDKYTPRRFEEIEDNGISLINEPVPPDNVSTLVRPKQRSLHAVLCEALTNTQGQRLEAGIYVAREVVRELYVRDGS
jgi:hypothetical protein